MHLYDIAVISLLSGFLYLTWKIWKYFYNLYRLPAGPVGLPFLGVATRLEPSQVTEALQEWKDQYGDIYSFTLPGTSVVVVSSYELIKDVLLKRSDEFAGRPQNSRLTVFTGSELSVAFSSDCPKLRLLKKVMNTSIKMYGERLVQLETISLKAVEEMIELWKTYKDKPFDPYASIHDLTSKIITSLLFGTFMTEEENKINLILNQDFLDHFSPNSEGQILDVFPWMRYFLPRIWNNLLAATKRSEDHFNGLHQKCMERYDGKNPECVYHSWYLYKKRMEEETGKKDLLKDIDIFNLSRAVVGAGTTTTFTATHSFVAILTNKPELQQRLQKEVDGALGDETPRLADKARMPLIEATMYELLRYISHVPVLIPHTTMKDTTLGGYPIPKDTQVWVNAFGLHHDPRYWDEPWEFKPERYLDEEGKLVTPDHMNRRRLLPFGAGRRSCPGEVLAKNRLFLIMASILQNFNFEPKNESERPKHDPRNYETGLTMHPRDYEVRAVNRK